MAIKITGSGPEKRYWELYMKATDAARYMINLTKTDERDTVRAYIGDEEAKELISLWRKLYPAAASSSRGKEGTESMALSSRLFALVESRDSNLKEGLDTQSFAGQTNGICF
jgi:hypothetical protein